MQDPTPETLKNRKAGTELMQQAAMRGDRICSQAESLMHLAGASGFFANEQVDMANEDDGWDDCGAF